MMTVKFVLKNLIGAGLRTWLNVFVLSIAFVMIVGMQGLYIGMGEQMAQAQINVEVGGGQFWHPEYDRFDPFTLDKSHGEIPEFLQKMISEKDATPLLLSTGTIFPEGRVLPVLLKGIDPQQTILEIPSTTLLENTDDLVSGLPVLIGKRMSKSANLNIGDQVLIRWRNVHGTFDAAEAQIVHIMETTVQSIDKGNIWLPLDKLQNMLEIPNEATIIIAGKNAELPAISGAWSFRDLDFLLDDVKQMIKQKSIGGSIFYGMIMFMALIAIFDTQVLSIFRRRKEMGTLLSLGMTRSLLIRIFTLEGAMHGILALLVGAIYGIPLLTWFARTGWALPDYVDDMGVALGKTIFPIYGLKLVIITTIIVMTAVTVISFLPTRKIAKLNPTDALRGKIS